MLRNCDDTLGFDPIHRERNLTVWSSPPPAGGTVVVPCGRASLGCAVCEMANAMGVSHLDQDRTTLV